MSEKKSVGYIYDSENGVVEVTSDGAITFGELKQILTAGADIVGGAGAPSYGADGVEYAIGGPCGGGGITKTDWQPIETAPRDGTVILGYDPTLYDIATLMDFDSREGKWMLFHVAEVVHPTHWMPPPEPPGDGEK